MKSFFNARTIVALAAAVAALTGNLCQAQDQPAPPAASALPAGVEPGSPLAEVIRLAQAGVDAPTIRGYISNSPNPFNLDADKILFLKDDGLPSDLINAMLDHDRALFGGAATPAPSVVPVANPVTTYAEPAPAEMAPAPAPVPDNAPPTQEVDMGYFQNTLTPYGTWVTVDGYGQCWRPTVGIYDATWRPYGTRGHWVNSDYGWFWDSDYAWGVTFHYGRWFHQAQFGWCWYPDTVWAPSWVAWRSGDAYCGWAPLPPFAVFTPGAGFYFRGVSVGLNFDFGLDADCFVFLPLGHFCDRRPDAFFAPRQNITQIYRQTTIINNYNVNGRTIVNRGIAVDHFANASHHPIETVHIASLPNANRQGWRAGGLQPTTTHTTLEANHLNNNNTLGHNTIGGNQSHIGTEAVAHPNNGQTIHYPNQTHVDNTLDSVHNQSVGHVNNGTETLHNETLNHVNTTTDPSHNLTPSHFNSVATPNNENLGHTGQGSQTESHTYQFQSHTQSGVSTSGQPHESGVAPSPGSSSHVESFSGTSHSYTQTPQYSQSHNSYNSAGSTPTAGGSVQHGGTQLQQHGFTASQPQTYSQPASTVPTPSQPQGHAPGNSGNNGGGNGNSGGNGSNNGGNRGQNHP
jgi:hypothetical protein